MARDDPLAWRTAVRPRQSHLDGRSRPVLAVRSTLREGEDGHASTGIRAVTDGTGPPASEAARQNSGIDTQVRGRWLRRHLVEQVADPAAVIRRVIHDMEHDRGAAHLPDLAGNELESERLIQARVRLAPAPALKPVVAGALRLGKRLHVIVHGHPAGCEPVIAALEVRAPDQIDDVAVIECTDDRLEQWGPLTMRFAGR